MEDDDAIIIALTLKAHLLLITQTEFMQQYASKPEAGIVQERETEKSLNEM